jgi:hypothetical protein
MNRIALGAERFVRGIPIVRAIGRHIREWMVRRRWAGSEDYWIRRYRAGGTSGDGSRNNLARFKATVLNRFVKDNNIINIIEYGCGDGVQLCLADYEDYLGFDISEDALLMCRRLFDNKKQFKLASDYEGETADLTMSLDVIYHLVEDSVFDAYMRRLFDSSRRFVSIYSSNKDEQDGRRQSPHIRHRQFSRWVDQNAAGWKLIHYIPNKYPYGTLHEGSFADFYIYEKAK